MKEKLIAVEILVTVLLKGSDIWTQTIGIDDAQIHETQLLEIMEVCAGHCLSALRSKRLCEDDRSRRYRTYDRSL